jgi:succinate dehydrogenase / fumarate reductase cytochrome b subunit
MIPILEALRSSMGRKLLTSFTGIALGLFVIAHLAGNVLLYLPDGSFFNEYAYRLEKMKAVKIGAEIGLIFVFGLHIINSIALKMGHRKARGAVGYRKWQTKANCEMETPSNPGSRMMAISGLVLLIFLPFHIKHFTLGAGITEGYYTLVGNDEARDLHRLVVESFQNPLMVAFYVLAMLGLAAHLQHGYWSFFQSMGWVTPRNHRTLQRSGRALAVLLAIGFLMIPVYIYLRSTGGAA